MTDRGIERARVRAIDSTLTGVEQRIRVTEQIVHDLLVEAVELDLDIRSADRGYLQGDDSFSYSPEADLAA